MSNINDILNGLNSEFAGDANTGTDNDANRDTGANDDNGDNALSNHFQEKIISILNARKRESMSEPFLRKVHHFTLEFLYSLIRWAVSRLEQNF